MGSTTISWSNPGFLDASSLRVRSSQAFEASSWNVRVTDCCRFLPNSEASAFISTALVKSNTVELVISAPLYLRLVFGHRLKTLPFTWVLSVPFTKVMV